MNCHKLNSSVLLLVLLKMNFQFRVQCGMHDTLLLCHGNEEAFLLGTPMCRVLIGGQNMTR